MNGPFERPPMLPTHPAVRRSQLKVLARDVLIAGAGGLRMGCRASVKLPGGFVQYCEGDVPLWSRSTLCEACAAALIRPVANDNSEAGPEPKGGGP